MRAVFRLLLLAVLAVALPMQGLAAATMQLCGTAAPELLQEHDEHTAAGHEHHHAAAPAADDEADSAVPAGHGCSFCAACFVGAALPSTAVHWTAPPLAQRFADAAPVRIAPFSADGLERPPRTALV